ncbi:MAG: MBL fold metallo-hydrolase [Clostridiaceae bacterium]|nr:MBL fold metallo-hydrolase [Clostridiaceae bacterium]
MEIINLKLKVTNCFLIKCETKYILIDTGYEYEWELFCKKLKDVSVSINEISHIILTHHHDDHCGLLNNLLEANKDIRVVMSHLAKDLLLKGENDITHGGGLVNKRISLLFSLERLISNGKGVVKRTLKFNPYKTRENDILVKGETQLKDIGVNLQGKIIETPGHSIDSISIMFEDGNSFVGDAAANFLQFAGTKYCVVFICDMDEYYNSWRKIISNHAKEIFPAHGRPFNVKKLKANIGKNKRENMVMNLYSERLER